MGLGKAFPGGSDDAQHEADVVDEVSEEDGAQGAEPSEPAGAEKPLQAESQHEGRHDERCGERRP